MPRTNYIDIMEKNHMEIPWHDYTNADSNALIANADLICYHAALVHGVSVHL